MFALPPIDPYRSRLEAYRQDIGRPPQIIGKKRNRETPEASYSEHDGLHPPEPKMPRIKEAVRAPTQTETDVTVAPIDEWKEIYEERMKAGAKSFETIAETAGSYTSNPLYNSQESIEYRSNNSTPPTSISPSSIDGKYVHARTSSQSATTSPQSSDKTKYCAADTQTDTESPGIPQIHNDERPFSSEINHEEEGCGAMLKAHVNGKKRLLYVGPDSLDTAIVAADRAEQELAAIEAEYEIKKKEFREKSDALDDKLSDLHGDIIGLERRMGCREGGPTKKQIKKLARLQEDMARAYAEDDDLIRLFRAQDNVRNAALQRYLALEEECDVYFRAARKTIPLPTIDTTECVAALNPKALDNAPITSDDRWTHRPWKRGINHGPLSDSCDDSCVSNPSKTWSVNRKESEKRAKAAEELNKAQEQYEKALRRFDHHRASYEEHYIGFTFDNNLPLNKNSQEKFAPIFVEKGRVLAKVLGEAEVVLKKAKDVAMNAGVMIHADQQSHFPERFDTKEHNLLHRVHLDREHVESWMDSVKERKPKIKRLVKNRHRNRWDKDEETVLESARQCLQLMDDNMWQDVEGQNQRKIYKERNGSTKLARESDTESFTSSTDTATTTNDSQESLNTVWEAATSINDSQDSLKTRWEPDSLPDRYYKECWDTRSALPREDRRQDYIDTWANATRRGYR